MDARERLRLYLEQRRELGESELVLDGMPVDDVMSLLGARPTARAPRTGKPPVSAMLPPAQARNTPSLPPDAARAPSEGTPSEKEQSDTPPTHDVIAPPTPEIRFDPLATNTNWRETLRQATAGTGGTSSSPSTSPTPARSDAFAAHESSARRSATSVDGSAAARAEPKPALLPEWLRALDVSAGISSASLASAANTDERAGLVQQASDTDALRAVIAACTACALHATARNPVPGEGNPHAEFVCVGEAPGANEDEKGQPFVGDAGQLLTKILGAIELTRESVFICNVLKHRPPANRDPQPDEVSACTPFLQRQLELVRPRVILALGRFAAQALLGTTLPIGKLRGQVHLYADTPVIVTYHPAALLRNEAWKRPTWEDVKLARRVLDASRAAMPSRSAGDADSADGSR